MIEFMNNFSDLVFNTFLPFVMSFLLVILALLAFVFVALLVALSLFRSLRDFFFENVFEFEESEKKKYLEEDNAYFRHMLYDCGKQNDVIDYDNIMFAQRKGKW